MKTINNVFFRVFVLSLLIIAMILILRDNPTGMQYWISFIISVISLVVINIDVYRLLKGKKKETQE
jgi:uncharacterized protein (DUF983 family)